MSADERVAEVAAILAAAVLRLRRRHALALPSTAQISSYSAQTGLEVPADLRLHGQHG
jgi:hypothetical protein